MAADGLVDAGSEGVRGRKTYTITPEGTRRLHEWMLEHAAVGATCSEVALQAFRAGAGADQRAVGRRGPGGLRGQAG
ncbi:hypothetical protein AB0G05_34520 [Nonomuraea wenchangensis]